MASSQVKWTDLCNEKHQYSWLNIHLALKMTIFFFSKKEISFSIGRFYYCCLFYWGNKEFVFLSEAEKNWPLSPSSNAGSPILKCNACRNAYISGKCGLHASVKTWVSWNVQGISLLGEPRGLDSIFCAVWAGHTDGHSPALLLGPATGTAVPEQTRLRLWEIQTGKLFKSRMATQGAEKSFEWSHRKPSLDENYNGKRGTIKWDTSISFTTQIVSIQ